MAGKKIDEEKLSEVSGGRGEIPPEGIQYSTYGRYDAEAGFYYCNASKTEYVYVFEIRGACCVYTKEYFNITPWGWTSTPLGGKHYSLEVFKFNEEYKYRLNVRP